MLIVTLDGTLCRSTCRCRAPARPTIADARGHCRCRYASRLASRSIRRASAQRSARGGRGVVQRRHGRSRSPKAIRVSLRSRSRRSSIERPNTVGRFSDVPVFAWYEREPTARGVRYRYSVIFTNEDGGTPADRLMATWGRTTDIEYLYSVEIDATADIVAEDYQGPDHEMLRVQGPARRESSAALGQRPTTTWC